MSKVINRVYTTYSEAVSVVRNLEAADVPHRDISIVANNVDKTVDPSTAAKGAGTGAAAGATAGGAAGLLAGLGMLAIPGVGPVVAAGWLIATAAGAAAGASAGAVAGGIIGKLVEHDVSKEDAELYMETIRRGGALVSVRTTDDNRAKVEELMDTGSFLDVQSRRAAYESDKWAGYDPNATVYTAGQINQERTRYR